MTEKRAPTLRHIKSGAKYKAFTPGDHHSSAYHLSLTTAMPLRFGKLAFFTVASTVAATTFGSPKWQESRQDARESIRFVQDGPVYRPPTSSGDSGNVLAGQRNSANSGWRLPVSRDVQFGDAGGVDGEGGRRAGRMSAEEKRMLRRQIGEARYDEVDRSSR